MPPRKLPFPLGDRHRYYTLDNWKGYGLVHPNPDELYDEYIWAKKCELCNKEFKNSQDRQMDHDHSTGEFRAVLCKSCNGRRSDRKMHSNNTSGHKYICKRFDPRFRQGFTWVFRVRIDGVFTTIKSSVDLDRLVRFRDDWFREHDYHT